jgi:hypothetical protein
MRYDPASPLWEMTRAMRLRNLERSGGVGNDMKLSIPLPKTPDGRVYRHSPNATAHPRLFLATA